MVFKGKNMLKKLGILFIAVSWVFSSTAQGMDLYGAGAGSQDKRSNRLTIYCAQRVATLCDPNLLLPITKEQTSEDIGKLFSQMKLDRGSHDYNGVWLFKNRHQPAQHNLPAHLKSVDVVRMILGKISASDVLVAKISPQAFGTIAEVGWAAAQGKPVYVFLDPEVSFTEEQLLELWFVFQTGATTEPLWKEEHFNLDIMPIKTTLADYRQYLQSIKAPFLRDNS